MTIEDIAEKLMLIIEDGKQEQQSNIWKEKYERLVGEIKNEKVNAGLLMLDMKLNGLTVGIIECEGYMRCAITIENVVKHIEEVYPS